MTDQCKNCTVRGDLKACLVTECFQHENWYAIEQQKRISLLESQVAAMTMLLKNVTATEFEGIQCKDIAFTGNWFDARNEIINQ